jgi:hypothetical protein
VHGNKTNIAKTMATKRERENGLNETQNEEIQTTSA